MMPLRLAAGMSMLLRPMPTREATLHLGRLLRTRSVMGAKSKITPSQSLPAAMRLSSSVAGARISSASMAASSADSMLVSGKQVSV